MLRTTTHASHISIASKSFIFIFVFASRGLADSDTTGSHLLTYNNDLNLQSSAWRTDPAPIILALLTNPYVFLLFISVRSLSVT